MQATTLFLLSLILLGAIQGFIVSGMLFSSFRSLKGSIFLAMAILLIAMANVNAYFLEIPLGKTWEQIGHVLPLVVFMPIGPLLWMYFRSASHGVNFMTRDSWHFVPVILDLLPYAAAAGYYLRIYDQKQIFDYIYRYNIYIDILRWISLSSYLLASYKLLTNHSSGNQNQLSNLKKLLVCFIAFQAVWFIFLVPYVWPGSGAYILEQLGWFPVYIPLTILVYAAGAISLRMMRNEKDTIKTVQSSTPLSEIEAGMAIQLLTKSMETDLLYLNPDLKLSTVMEHTGLTQKMISTVLNQYDKGFNGFVNSYRLTAFKQRIISNGPGNLTLNGVAMECGFSSQSTFQRVFKEMEGVSPSEYVRIKNQVPDLISQI